MEKKWKYKINTQVFLLTHLWISLRLVAPTTAPGQAPLHRVAHPLAAFTILSSVLIQNLKKKDLY